MYLLGNNLQDVRVSFKYTVYIKYIFFWACQASHQVTTRKQGCKLLVTTLLQPCHNLAMGLLIVTSLLQPCNNLATTLQACSNLVCFIWMYRENIPASTLTCSSGGNHLPYLKYRLHSGLTVLYMGACDAFPIPFPPLSMVVL